MSDGGDSSSLYWSGTYKKPTEATKEYRWESQNDKTQTDSSLLASRDDTKVFEYKNKEIIFKLSVMGITSNITLSITESYYKKATAYRYAICLKEDNIPIGYVWISDDESNDFGYG